MIQEKTYFEGTKEELIKMLEQNFEYKIQDSILTFKDQVSSISEYSENGFGAIAFTIYDDIKNRHNINFIWIRIKE